MASSDDNDKEIDLSDAASRLLELARKRFGDLTPAEEMLFQRVAKGEEIEFPEERPEKEKVLNAERIAWLCTDREASGLVTHRGIWLRGANVDGKLDLSFAAISFGLAFLDCTFSEEINLQYAKMPALNLKGTQVPSIRADRLQVEGDVFLREVFESKGEVRLLGATIRGNLDCENGEFINPDNDALSADGLNVEGAVFLRDGFQAKGRVSLVSATIHRYLDWTAVTSPKDAYLDLRSAKIGTLRDERESWPQPGRLFLHGLVYDEIDDDSPTDAKSRIDWLQRQPRDRYLPQPYEQLAAVLRKAGYEEAAKDVLIEKARERVRVGEMSWFKRLFYKVVFGPVIQYGHRPLRALWFALLIVLVGWVLFGLGFSANVITPTQRQAYVTQPDAKAGHLSEDYPKFCAFMYSLDVFVPLVDLYQASYWLPNANQGRELPVFGIFSIRSGGLLRLYFWLHIIAGWVLSTLLVVGLTGVIRG